MYSWLLVVGYARATFPIGAMLIAPFLSLFGGGDCVLNTVMATYITELTTNNVQWASWFAYMSSISYISSILGPTVAATTMAWSIWFPFVIGMSSLLVAMLIARSLPDQSHEFTDSEENTAASSQVEPLLGQNSGARDAPKEDVASFTARIISDLRKVMQAFKRPRFRLLLSVFFLASLASSNTPLLAQYISKRYGWTLSDAGYLLSVKAVINVILLTIVVPTSIRYLSKQTTEGTTTNIIGAAASISFSVLGAALVGLSVKTWQLLPSLILYAAGSALPVFTMSLVRSPTIADSNQEAHANDYSIVMILRTLGTCLGLPLMTVAWSQGIHFGGSAMGLPYYLSGTRSSTSWTL
ncbi:hypothetical protein BT63DRAFT_159691 [Microthyrium microscopicum]|uniref:MFS general substrate transporter n=1 Tax=Microthyrium microscopicum TaxID=703497 RepID=A0A6A6UQ16_9PEZI|nr:hypothetical protein BT63DRAFT_159691 [Microthyrium microscopicum]